LGRFERVDRARIFRLEHPHRHRKGRRALSANKDRSANGAINVIAFDSDEASFIAAKYFLVLNAARAL
jgi:hypothetical protein